MPRDPSTMPSDLRDRLREESAEEQNDLEDVWSLLGTTDPSAEEEADAEGAWETVTQHHPELAAVGRNGQAATGEREDPGGNHPRRKQRAARRPTRRRRRQWGWAVALVVLLLVGGAWLWRQPVTVTAPAGQQVTQVLPDGSTVQLNSGTTIAYRRSFQTVPFVDAHERIVRLDGEAFFEVEEAERPFVVETASAQVEVTGTRFNVRAHATEEAATEVTLASGQVQVAPRQRPERNVVLGTPGQTSRVADSRSAPSTPQSLDLEHVLVWLDDGFAVRDRPLSLVLRELERRYDVTIRLHPSVDRPEAPLSLYYPDPTDLETILHDLCTARGLNYRPTSQGFEVFAETSGP